MLKYKKHKFDTISNLEEPLIDMLAGMEGKNRKIVSITCDKTANIYLRVYRDAEQIVDLDCNKVTNEHPWVAMDLPLAVGQLCKTGFYNLSAGDVTPTITIGYEETG